MTTPLEIEEYKAKWEYVRHTEKLQAEHVQWYFGIVGGVLAFLYGGQSRAVVDMVGGPWVPLVVLALYSVLVELRLLVQKRNYDIYTARLRQFEGQKPNGSRIRQKVFSVFKLQYYSVVLVGAVVVAALFLEATRFAVPAVIAGASFTLLMLTLSFSALIGD